MRRVVSLFLPRWPTDRVHRAQVAEAACDASREAPLLMAARQGAKRVVTAVDAQAASLGLCVGMAVAQAQALVPALRIEEAVPADDAASLQRLAVWCLRQYSPLVAVSGADGLWIDVTGCAHLFGGEGALLAQLCSRLAQDGVRARAAVADTAGAAHALARYGKAEICVSAPGGLRDALRGLPVAALRLPEDRVQALRNLGFDTIGDVLAAPRAPLAKRLGAEVLRRLDQALGVAAEPIAPLLPPDLPRTRQGFPEPIATAEDLARAVCLLVERLCEKLQQRGLGACRLDLVFQRVDGAMQAIRIGTAAASRDVAHLQRLLVAKIETIDPGFGIEAMMLSAPLTDRLGASQSISDVCVSGRVPDVTALVDSLANRLGASRVYRMVPVQSDVPERSLRAVAPMARAEGAGWPDRLPRPARLFTPPHHVEAMALLPDHAPVQFTWRRRSHRVCRADGPERVFGEWWRDDAEMWAIRDYFQVEDEAGQRFWLFRRGDGESGVTGDLHWFLHGMFG